MKKFLSILGFAFINLLAGLAHAQAIPGKEAPAFTLVATSGEKLSLSDFRGKFVVLEWVNHGCPFVRKHYDSANMQKLQKTYRDQGVIWLSVQSTNPDHPDYESPAALAETMRSMKAAQHATLMDPDGVVGRLYGAKTTPHMYLIDKAGKLIYAGAIDDIRSTSVADVARANNHLVAALDAALAGKPVTLASTTAYGCSIKYR